MKLENGNLKLGLKNSGYGRFTPADRRLFYRYARVSFEETKTWLRKLIRRKIVNTSEIKEYESLINSLGPKLNAFIRSTN
jgi:four helix bundle protein